MPTDREQQEATSALGLDGYDALQLLDDRGVGRLYATHDRHHHRPLHLRVGTGPDAQVLRDAFDSWRRVGGHPNVVTAFNLRESTDGTIVAIELEPSPETLEERLRTTGPLPFVAVLSLGTGLAGALSELHRLDIVHGAITASSVVLSPDGRPQISDVGFGHLPADRHDLDVGALGAVLAIAMGATATPATPDPLDPRHRVAWTGAGEVPDRVRSEIEAMLGGAIGSADLAGRRLRDLHVHYTGRRPSSSLGYRPWAGAVLLDGGVGLADPSDSDSRSTLTHHAPMPPEPSSSWLEDRSPVRPASVTVTPPSPGDAAESEGSDGASGAPETAAAPTGRRCHVAALAIAAVCVALLGAVVITSSTRTTPPRPATTTVGTRPRPTPESTTTQETTAIPVPPAPATEVAAEYVGQQEVRLTWQHNASVDEGYLVRIQEFRFDPVTGATQGGPVFSGWVGADLRPATAPGDLLPRGSTELRLPLGSTSDGPVLTCLKPVAVRRGRKPVEAEGEPVCVPAAVPSAPTTDYPPVSARPSGPLDLSWADTSFDETGFVVFELGPDDVVAHWRSVEPRVRAGELASGQRRCFAVKAENARNHVEPPRILDERSLSEPFCFEGR